MNGRVYDYNLGRFLSVDPFIQSSGNSQSMNPYSYIMNNPLSGTDPTGYMASCAGQYNINCIETNTYEYRTGIGGNSSASTDNGKTKKQSGTQNNKQSASPEEIGDNKLKDSESNTAGNNSSSGSGSISTTGGTTKRDDDFMAVPLSQDTIDKSGAAYLRSAKNAPNTVKLNVTTVLVANGKNGEDYSTLSKVFQERANSLIGYLEEKGIPYEYSKVSKIWLIIDPTIVDSDGNPYWGDWGPGLSSKSERALRINPVAFNGLSGPALKSEVGNTVGN
jgi:hypothetical protein